MAVYPKSTDEIHALAQAVLSRQSVVDYIADCRKQGVERSQTRRYNNVPVIAFIGNGRCGKDTAAKWLAANYKVEYTGSVSYAVAPIVAEAVQDSVENVFTTRHNNRQFWFEFCNGLRATDPTLLIRLTLSQNDVIAGIRGSAELEAGVALNFVDLVVWVEREGVPVDPTMVELSPDDAHIVIENNVGLVHFYQRLRTLADLMRISERAHH